jgi:hypothetical protein
MLRRVCSTSVVTLKQVQCQQRLLNVSAVALRDATIPDQNKEAKKFNQDFKKEQASSMTMPLLVVGGAVAVGAAYYFMRSKNITSVDDAKNHMAGAYVSHKANKEFENAKEVVLKVAKEIGGKDLADKVAKIIDEAKDAVAKYAGDMPNAQQTVGKVYRQGKETIDNISEGGIGAYVKEFDKIKDMVLKEAEKMGGKDMSKKAQQVFDQAKDKMSKIATGKMSITEYVKEYENVKDYVLKEIKKNGGDDLSKSATKYFDEAKDKLQSMAGAVGQGGFGDKEFEKVKEYVVKEAEKLGGRDLAKKAAKLMDEAKETLQKIAAEFAKSGDAGKALSQAKDAVQKKIS